MLGLVELTCTDLPVLCFWLAPVPTCPPFVYKQKVDEHGSMDPAGRVYMDVPVFSSAGGHVILFLYRRNIH